MVQYLTDGGLPRGWSVQNLVWLAQAHRREAQARWSSADRAARALWHARWAALIEDVLETHHVNHH